MHSFSVGGIGVLIKVGQKRDGKHGAVISRNRVMKNPPRMLACAAQDCSPAQLHQASGMRGDGRAWWMMLATVVPDGTFVTWPGHDTARLTEDPLKLFTRVLVRIPNTDHATTRHDAVRRLVCQSPAGTRITTAHAAARCPVLARSAIAPYLRSRVDPPRLKFLSRSHRQTAS